MTSWLVISNYQTSFLVAVLSMVKFTGNDTNTQFGVRGYEVRNVYVARGALQDEE